MITYRNHKLLTIDEVAEILGITTRSVYRWHERGQFPRPVHVSNRPMWLQETVDAWIEAKVLEAQALAAA